MSLTRHAARSSVSWRWRTGSTAPSGEPLIRVMRIRSPDVMTTRRRHDDDATATSFPPHKHELDVRYGATGGLCPPFRCLLIQNRQRATLGIFLISFSSKDLDITRYRFYSITPLPQDPIAHTKRSHISHSILCLLEARSYLASDGHQLLSRGFL